MSNTSVPDNISDCDLDYIANEIINSGEVESELLTLISLWMHIKEYGILKPSQNLPQRSVKMDGFDKQDICVYCKVDTDSHLTIA